MSEQVQPGPETAVGQKAKNQVLLVVGWLWVGIPLAWGVTETVRQSLALFQ